MVGECNQRPYARVKCLRKAHYFATNTHRYYALKNSVTNVNHMNDAT